MDTNSEAKSAADSLDARHAQPAVQEAARAASVAHEMAIATAAREWFDNHVHSDARRFPWIPMPLITALVEDYDARHPDGAA